MTGRYVQLLIELNVTILDLLFSTFSADPTNSHTSHRFSLILHKITKFYSVSDFLGIHSRKKIGRKLIIHRHIQDMLDLNGIELRYLHKECAAFLAFYL